MKNWKISIYTLLFCLPIASNCIAQQADSTYANGRYISVVPLIGGRWLQTGTTLKNDVLLLGLRMGQGISMKNFLLGADLSYDYVYQAATEEISRAYLRFYGEHHFFRYKKLAFLIGLSPYLFRYEYTPDYKGFRFLEDPVDGEKKIHYLSGICAYTGIDLRFKKKYHIVLGLGYDKKFTDKTGVIPDDVGATFRLDFRTPFPKLLMSKKSKMKNYY